MKLGCPMNGMRNRWFAAGLRAWLVAAGMSGLFAASADAAKPQLSEDVLATISNLNPQVTDQPPPDIFLSPTVVASKLKSPDGLVCDPASGDVYVADEEAVAIYRIKPNGRRELMFDATTPIFDGQGKARKRQEGLRSPEGMALGPGRMLYVVEDVPGGRLIVFDAEAQPNQPAAARGQNIPIPIANSQFAWESVDVRATGELLVAGSTAEAVAQDEESGDLFRGAVLYRDGRGDWWVLLNHVLASYSAACFSRDGNYMFFACEISGALGILDLRTQVVRTFIAEKAFRSPEGLCALPGDVVLVAEEGGKVYWWDPTSDTVQLIYQNSGTIESVCWDAPRRRLLLTDDQAGQALALEMKQGLAFRRAMALVDGIQFDQGSAIVDMVPARCPSYLKDVLKMGGYDAERFQDKLSFRDFAKRYCLVAVDAETRLLPGQESVEDPIAHIQFVVLAPYLIGFDEGQLLWASSGFTVLTQSGQLLKTELVKRQVIKGRLLENRFASADGQSIALPIPFTARINAEGLVTVHFLGMGVMPDYSLVLDSAVPNNSVMVVVQPDGIVQQYQVRLPDKKRRNHWVIALEHKEPETWKKLTPEKEEK